MSSNLNVNAPEFYPRNIRMVKHSYEKELKLFKKAENKQDTEYAHIIQDRIYRKFINDIQSGKLSKMEEIHFVSCLIVNQVIVYDKNRWYA
jgi:hypothetical protein